MQAYIQTTCLITLTTAIVGYVGVTAYKYLNNLYTDVYETYTQTKNVVNKINKCVTYIESFSNNTQLLVDFLMTPLTPTQSALLTNVIQNIASSAMNSAVNVGMHNAPSLSSAFDANPALLNKLKQSPIDITTTFDFYTHTGSPILDDSVAPVENSTITLHVSPQSWKEYMENKNMENKNMSVNTAQEEQEEIEEISTPNSNIVPPIDEVEYI